MDNKYLRIAKHIISALMTIVCNIIVFQWAYMFAYPSDNELMFGYDVWRPIILPVITATLFYFFFVRIRTLYDETLREEYFSIDSKIRFLPFLIKNPVFWLNSMFFVLFVLFFDLKKFATVLHGLFANDRLEIILYVLPIYMVIDILARLSAVRRWKKNKMLVETQTDFRLTEGSLPDGGFPMMLFGRLSLLNHMTLFHSTAPKLENNGEFEADYSKKAEKESISLLFVATVIALLLGRITYKLIIGIVFPLHATILKVIVAIVLGIFIYRRVRALIARMSFLSKLKKITKEQKLKLSNIKAPYISVYKDVEGDNFCLTVDRKVYSCKMISCLSKSIPLILKEDGNGVRIKKTTFAGIHLRQKPKRFRYGYESRNTKILIINPSTKYAYLYKNGGLGELDNGLRVGEYIIYTAGSFLRAIERGCIEETMPKKKIGE